MHGTTLYPLNTLQTMNVKSYTLEARKYARRQEVRKVRIPKLGCLWNDVVHCLPMDPSRVYRALVECGLSPGKRYWFALDVARIMMNRCAWFEFRTSPPFPVPDDEVRVLTAETYHELDAVPANSVQSSGINYTLLHGIGLHFRPDTIKPPSCTEKPVNV